MDEAKMVDYLLDKLANDFANGAKEVKVNNADFINYSVIKQLVDEGFKVKVNSSPELLLIVS